MPPLATKKKPIQKNVPLNLKMKQANALQAQIISEQRKEIARLQKLLAKKEVKHDSEIAGYKAQLAEEKKNKIHVVLQKYDKDGKEIS